MIMARTLFISFIQLPFSSQRSIYSNFEQNFDLKIRSDIIAASISRKRAIKTLEAYFEMYLISLRKQYS